MNSPQKIISSEASLHPDLPFFYGRRIVETQTTRSILFSKDFLLSFCSFFFLWISFDFFLVFPLFILDRGGNSVDVGLQTAIFFFPSVLIRPVAGWLTDRFGRLKILWSGISLMIATSLAFLLLHGGYREIKFWMGAILFLRGAAFAAFYTAFFTYAADLSMPENRARVIGLFGISGLVAHGLAPRTAEMVIRQWQFPGYFWAMAILATLSLLISVFLSERPRPSASGERGFTIFRSVTFSRRNVISLPGAFVFGFAIASFSTFGAPYFKLSGMSVGSFFLTYGLTAGASRIILGGLADRFSRRILIAIFFGLEAAGIWMITLDPVHSFAITGAAICGIAHSILFPAMTAMIVDAHPPAYRGVVTSVFTAMIELGFSLGSYLLGFVVAGLGYKIMFLTAAAVGLLFAVYSAFAGRLTRSGKWDHT